MATDFSKIHYSVKIGFGFAAINYFVVVLLALLVSHEWSDVCTNIMIIVAASMLGWFSGMFCSPDDKQQQKNFSGIFKSIAAGVGGYLFSKFDKVLSDAFRFEYLMIPVNSFRVLAAASSFLIIMMLAYLLRKYE
jgi:ABC-type multidrug transport system permease subunit